MPYPNGYGFNIYGNAQQNPMLMPSVNMLMSVNGIEPVKSYITGPNSSLIFFDSNKPIMYVKRTDSSCYPTVEAYGLTKVDLDDLSGEDANRPSRNDVEDIINERFSTIENDIDEIKGMLRNESSAAKSVSSEQRFDERSQSSKANGRRKSGSPVQSDAAN